MPFASSSATQDSPERAQLRMSAYSVSSRSSGSTCTGISGASSIRTARISAASSSRAGRYTICATLFLRLDEAFYKPALHQQPDQDRRQYREQRRRHDDLPFRLRVAIADHLTNADDDCRHRWRVRDEQRPQILVPAVDEEDHEERGDVGARQGYDGVDQKPPRTGAVDLRRLDELIGDRQKELAKQQRRGRRGDQRQGQPAT